MDDPRSKAAKQKQGEELELRIETKNSVHESGGENGKIQKILVRDGKSEI